MNHTTLYVLVCLSILAVLCPTTYVYLSVYRIPQEESIERHLGKLYSGPSGNNDDNGDAVGRRDKILRMRKQLGVGIDSLQTVRFSSTASEEEESGDDNEEEQILARQHECLTIGVYLSPEDDYLDCRSYCGVTDGVDYRFYDRTVLILNACNSNTSLVLYTKHGWRCMPQMRAFGDEGGNLITACNGTLLDRATGPVWRKHIDPTLTFDSIDEKLPNVDERDEFDGYRIVCPPGSTGEISNALIPAPFDRLLHIRNVCASLIPYADTEEIRPNFLSGECECDDAKILATLNRRIGVRTYALIYDRIVPSP